MAGQEKGLIQQAKDYLEIRKNRDEIRAQLTEAQKKMDEAEAALAEQFGIEGIQNLKLADNQTLYRAVEFHASVKAENREAAIAAFRSHGLGHLLSVQPMKLQSWVREQLNSEDGPGKIPEPFEDLIECYDRTRVRLLTS